MVSRDGNALVTDFGLARPRASASVGDETSEELSGSVLTAATLGQLAGTPAYMSPEQIQAKALTPAADQFAFCVSLWECAFRQRPFEGETVLKLFERVMTGQVADPPKGAPRWLVHVLRRGLATEPSKRWPSMTALITALERGRHRWRRQVALGLVTALAVVAGGVITTRRHAASEARERVAACQAKGAEIHALWNDRARDELRAGLLDTGVRFAEDSANTLIPWLDEYSRAWSSGRAAICLRDPVARGWDDELHARSAWCFEDRRLQLEATVEQITHLNRPSARRAVRLASYLDPVESCVDPNALRSLPIPPATMQEEVRSIRRRFTAADRLRHVGRYERALEVAELARERARQLEWPPLLAFAEFIVGRNSYAAGRLAEAERELQASYFNALSAGSVETAFRAARSLISVLVKLERFHEAETWGRHANLLSAQLDDPGGLDEAEGHYLAIAIHRGLGDYDAAARAGELAVALRSRALGAEHPITASAMHSLASVLLLQERPRPALEYIERSAAIWSTVVGPGHPYIAKLAALRGRALFLLGRPAESVAELERALLISEDRLRPDHPDIAKLLTTIGEVYAALGRLEDAERALRYADAILRAKFGPHHVSTTANLLALAVVDHERGDHETARARCQEGLEDLERSQTPGHPAVAKALAQCARVDAAAGEHDAAASRLARAIAGIEATIGPHSHRLMAPLIQLGETQRAARQLDDARASYTRALSIGELRAGAADSSIAASLTGLAELELARARGDASAARRYAARAVRAAERAGPRSAAAARFALARALAAGDDPDSRAASVAARARDDFVTIHDGAGRAEVERWLARHDH